MQFFDKVSAGNVRRTADGYLVADAKAARTGIQTYLGAEIGRPDLPKVRVYRPESEVFSRDSLASYAHKPATNDHPAELVTSDTWKAESIGQIGDDIVRDGDHVRVPLILMDAKAIKDYEGGKRELSMGYTAEIVFDAGITSDGEGYDAIQKDIRINHIALVNRGRAGSARIGDRRAPDEKDRAGKPSQLEFFNMTTKTILVDGLSVETTEAGAQAINKLQGQIKDADTARLALIGDHEKAIAAKDAEMAKRDAEIEKLKKQVLSDAEIDNRVKARAELLAAAKRIHDADYSGKSDADIRKAVVAAKFGDDAIKDKTQAYIDARFDILNEEKSVDPVRKVVIARDRQPVNDNGYAASVADLDFRTRNAKKEA